MITEGAVFSDFGAPHCVGLTIGSRDTPVMVLDTQSGLVHWEDCPDTISADPCRETAGYEADDDVDEEEANWRYDATAWTIPDFFEILKDQFHRLHWIPISSRVARSAAWGEAPENEGMVAELREVYRLHGWPDLDNYRKSECLGTVRRILEEKYPSVVDNL